ncbi:potassium voltage-gated channel subfamily S member 1 isoform X2 [Eurytemora carolleeae]|uniref:potassium voltage-gated channel subfamily S member 1 isoform X2 n=1 Tax=Eurytemora carolleeae TaxID=1294199 RepID=UPI000C78A7CC|nr:potassium voltage-gated channel subfamily S member 1 isoform X2 [Eurytemora carolleeae]|eukprot:XP_023326971.1 potassium voltage-gated channel subfamily S member 1-like isoform X2 [Eurytemora affinis]
MFAWHFTLGDDLFQLKTGIMCALNKLDQIEAGFSKSQAPRCVDDVLYLENSLENKQFRPNMVLDLPVPESNKHFMCRGSFEGSRPDTSLILRARQVNKRVALNVGGIRHEVMWKMLEQYPGSRLGALARAETHQDIFKLVSDYSLQENEFFFDR